MALFLKSKAQKTVATISPNEDVARFIKKRKRKKRLTIGAAVVLVAAVGIYFVVPKSISPIVSTTPISKGELVKTINVSGIVDSQNSMKVYSTVTAIVNEVTVKVGDTVKAGDTLAKLDTTDLNLSIAKQKAAMGTASQGSALNLSTAQEQLTNMKFDLANKRYAPLVQAEQAVDDAAHRLSEARSDYNDNDQDIDKADEAIRLTEKAMVAARSAMDSAAKTCKSLGKHTGNQHTADCTSKQAAYLVANRNWKLAHDELVPGLNSFNRAVQTAMLNYENALTAKELAEQEIDRTMKSLEDKIKGVEISADMTVEQLTLQKLNQDLADCDVKAPINGTVTAIYAQEGVPGSGLLFIVEDTNALVVRTTLKEYDIGSVKVDMPTDIKSDLSDTDVFEGKVSRISPAAVKSPDGSAPATGGVAFACDVDVTTPNSGLMVGMNVRLNIILEKRADVFNVPFDAVITNDAGENILYTLEGDGKSHTAKAHVVTVGLETDFMIEVSSDTLAEGAKVITTTAGLSDGMSVTYLTIPGMAV